MTVELKLLVWSAALLLLQTLIAVVTAIHQVGLSALAGNRENLPAIAGLAGRAQRAQRNMLENFVLFAALVFVAQTTARLNSMTVLGAELFFWARVVYVPIYVIGIPWLRAGHGPFLSPGWC